MAGRIGELLTAEREQVADLSHRLRTPITALRLDVESLSDPDERARLATDVDELTRQVDDVIREARRVEREGGLAGCDAAEVVSDRVRMWGALAEDQGRTARTDLTVGPLPTRLSADDLAAAVDALLGNVMAHTPEGAPLSVSLTREPDGFVRLVVEDGGSGIPEGSASVRGRSGSGSTGLGLDIARRTAVASGGSMLVDRSADLGGARVTLRLGPPTS